MSRGADTPGSLEDLCRSPWLIIYGQGPASEEMAQKVAAQCQQGRIRSRMRPIDECDRVELARFPGLVAVLPTFSSDLKIRQALEPFANLVADYRARWDEGLAGVRAGRVDPFDAGPVSLLGHRALLHNPTMRSALRRACAVQYLDEGSSIDVLQPYREASESAGHETPWERGDDVAVEVMDQTWAYLQTWGLVDPDRVPDLLQQIQRCRSYFENPIRPALYRPLPGYERNRLDIILDGPDESFGNDKTWKENGARVWRHVYAQLRAVNPAITRPGNPNRGNAQHDLRRLYLSLKVIDTWMRMAGGGVTDLSA